MNDIPLGALGSCILCDEIVCVGGDEKTWGLAWGGGRLVHYRCAYDLFGAVRRIQSKPEIYQLEERVRELETENEQLQKSLMDVRHIIGQVWTIEPLDSDKEKALHKAMVIIDAAPKGKS